MQPIIKIVEVGKKLRIHWRETSCINDQDKRRVLQRNDRRDWTRKTSLTGCILSLTLHNIYLRELIKKCFGRKKGVQLGERRIHCIRFSDYVAVMGESLEQFTQLTTMIKVENEKGPTLI